MQVITKWNAVRRVEKDEYLENLQISFYGGNWNINTSNMNDLKKKIAQIALFIITQVN